MNKRVLIVDDETNIRKMMELALSHSGYDVTTAADGPSGLSAFGDGSDYDLVLLDQRMPGLSGTEVQEKIYERDPDARVILITAFGTIELALEAIQAGATDFLRKPFNADTLRGAVKSALDTKFQTHSAVPARMVCKEFTKSTINGYKFSLDSSKLLERSGDRVYRFAVSQADAAVQSVDVILPAYIQELVLAKADIESAPSGDNFWQALSEECLAQYLWHNAAVPEGQTLRIEDISPSVTKWVESLLTVNLSEHHA